MRQRYQTTQEKSKRKFEVVARRELARKLNPESTSQQQVA